MLLPLGLTGYCLHYFLTPAAAAGLIRIACSETVVEQVRQELQRLPDETPYALSGGGSEVAMRALMSGKADIAITSSKMDIPDPESENDIAGIPLFPDTIFVVVHPDHPFQSLSRKEVREIFSGVSPRKSDFVVMVRPPGSGTARLFQNWIMENHSLSPEALILPHPEQIVQWMKDRPGSISYLNAQRAVPPLQRVQITGEDEVGYKTRHFYLYFRKKQLTPASVQLIQRLKEGGRS